MGKAAVFVDDGYFSKVTERYGNLRVDYESFTDTICEPDRRFRTYYYNCPPWQGNPPTEEERNRLSGYHKFTDALSYLDRFKVREGRLQRIDDEFRQKGVDIKLAVDAVKLSSTGKIDRAIFVTGDSDFVPVVEGIEGTGVTTALCYDPDLSVHNNIKTSVDERIEIDRALLESHLR